jgi:hypothetical protein
VDVVGDQVGHGSAAVVLVLDAHRARDTGHEGGWQRQRAWIEVFSSEGTIIERPRHPAPDAVLSIDRDPDHPGAVVLHVNSGGNALAC